MKAVIEHLAEAIGTPGADIVVFAPSAEVARVMVLGDSIDLYRDRPGVIFQPMYEEGKIRFANGSVIRYGKQDAE